MLCLSRGFGSVSRSGGVAICVPALEERYGRQRRGGSTGVSGAGPADSPDPLQAWQLSSGKKLLHFHRLLKSQPDNTASILLALSKTLPPSKIFKCTLSF